MNLKKLLLTTGIISTIFLTSCSSDDNNIANESFGNYDNGVFIVNEGNSNLSTASISFISENGNLENDVFRNVNPQAQEIGTFLQSMFFDDTFAYIISGSSNSITVVNRYTFKYVTTISSNLNNPRYGTIENGKAYVVNQAGWESGADDYITIINLSNFSTQTLAMNTDSEAIISENGRVYVSNGQFGNGNTITVINAMNDTIEHVINLGEGNSPNSIDEENGFLYALTTNYSGNALIQKISLSNYEIVETLTLNEVTSPKQLTIEENKIYFTDNASVYTTTLNLLTQPSLLLTYPTTSQWGAMYGFAVEDEKIYIADGGDFASDSQIYIYSTNGNLLNSYTVGVAPNGFYFNN